MARLGNNPTSVLEKSNQYGETLKLFFPLDLATNRISRFMSFEVLGRGNEEGIPFGTVCLPIPSNITDSFSHQYTDAALGPAASEAIKLGNASLATYAELLIKAGWQGGRAQLLSYLGSADASVIQRQLGDIVNPNLVNQYVNTGFKNHSFFFTLVAKNLDESNEIAAIVEFFKYYSSPNFVDQRNLVIPNKFNLAYNDSTISSNTTSKNQYLPKFTSSCFLTDMQVLYNGSGQPQFFASGAPVEVQLSLNFRETQITTADRLKETGNTDKMFERITSHSLGPNDN